MIKILVINTVRFKLNGISAVIKNYYQAMDKDGFEFEFLAIDTPSIEYQKFFHENNCIYHVITKKNILKYFVEIVNLCRKNKYDIVHIHGNSANMAIELLAATFGGVKHRITHSHNTATLHPMMHILLYPIFSALCNFRLACGSKAGKWLYRNKPFTVLKNGIDLEKYLISEEVRNQYRKGLNISKDYILIGHIGNFIEQKNHRYLIDIFEDVHKKNVNTALVLISDGILMGEIKKDVKKRGLKDSVIFLGKTLEVEKYLQAMDIFLLPSLYEGMPVVLIEAQASGLPCLISNTISNEVDITGCCRFLPITSETIPEWSKTIIEMTNTLKNKERTEIANENRRKIRLNGYDIKQNANILRQVYLKLIREN